MKLVMGLHHMSPKGSFGIVELEFGLHHRNPIVVMLKVVLHHERSRVVKLEVELNNGCYSSK